MHDNFAASVVENPRVDTPAEPLNLADIRNSLQSLMWRNMGVQRDAEGLAEAIESIDHWRGYVLPRQLADPAGWELQNMLCCARLMIEAARQRQESRGVHVRLRFPADRRRPLAAPHHFPPPRAIVRSVMLQHNSRAAIASLC